MILRRDRLVLDQRLERRDGDGWRRITDLRGLRRRHHQLQRRLVDRVRQLAEAERGRTEQEDAGHHEPAAPPQCHHVGHQIDLVVAEIGGRRMCR